MPSVRSLLVLVLLLALAAPTALAGPREDARAAAAAERWAEAVAGWQAVLEKRPDDREAMLGLAEAAHKAWDAEAMRGAEERLLARIEETPDDVEARLALGNVYIALAALSPDDQEKRFIYEDARTHFGAILEKDAAHEGAVVGLARTEYELADFSGALDRLDAFLEDGKSKGPALYWKGQVLYLLAQDAYQQAGELDDEVKRAFRQALDAYQASAEAGPENPQTWLQLAYTAQYLGEREVAHEAYDKAMALAPQSDLPLRGIEALYGYDAETYQEVLEELAGKHADNAPVHFYLGYLYLAQERFEKAVKGFETYVRKADEPGSAWTWLGKAYQGLDKHDKAEDAWRKALEADPTDANAAGAWDASIRRRLGAGAQQSPDAAATFLAAYEDLFELAPGDPWVRNNAAFVLREAVDRRRPGRAGQVPGAWKPVLDACIDTYVAAAEAVDARVVGASQRLPWATRYGYAGVLNDAGLMFAYYPSTREPQRAEDLYLQALALTDDGYYDAFTNVLRLYTELGRWQDLADIAAACAEGLKDERGEPHTTGRAQARGVLERMRREHGIGD